MSKIAQKPKRDKKLNSFYAIRPWSHQHQPDHSEVEVYITASNSFEIIAEIHRPNVQEAYDIAEFIVRVVNDAQRKQGLLRDAMETLELCLEEADMTFASEQAADLIVARIKAEAT